MTESENENSFQMMRIPETAVVDSSGANSAVSSDQASFMVFGTPAPQGSKNAMPIYKGPRKGLTAAERKRLRVFTGKVALVEQNRKNIDPWRAAVEAASRRVLLSRKRKAFTGPVTVGMGFALNRGTTVKRELPSTQPDISKLIRSTEDAITDAGLWGDDGLVTSYIWLEMVYAGDIWRTGPMAGQPAPQRPGAVILIAAVDVSASRASRVRRPSRPRRPVDGPRSAPERVSRPMGPPTLIEPSQALLEALRGPERGAGGSSRT